MPFPRHVIEPRHTRQGLPPKPEGARTTLEEYCNLTLANFIRQLANLSGQVNLIFGSLFDESEDLFRRLNELKTRLGNIEEKTKKLDPLEDNVGNGFGKDRKVVYRTIVDRNRFFQSERQLDTGLFMDNSQPIEVKELYQSAEAMPRLHELDQFRTDGKDGAKIYSNPNLFFLAWQDSLQKMITEQQAMSSITAKRTVRQTRLRRVKRAKASRIIEAQKHKMGAEFVPDEKRGNAEEEDEYFTEEEWSSSDDEMHEHKMTNGSLEQPMGNGHHQTPTVQVDTSGLPSPPTIPLPNMNIDEKRESATREFNFNDIEFMDPNTDLLPPAPLPPPTLGIETLKINGDFPPPIQDNDYSGRSAPYNIQTALDSLNAVNWADDT